MAKARNGFASWPIQFGVALLLLGALARPAAAQNTYTVSTAAELAAAIGNVNAGAGGDLIVLAPGTYSLTAPLTITRDVTIQGDPVGHSVIEGDGLTNLLVLRANQVSLLNFTIRNGLSAIYWAGAGALSVTGLTITDTRDGVDANEGEGEISITNSTISNNRWSGVQVMCPANLHMTNDTVSGNDIGVKVLFTCGNVIQITNTLIVGNTSSDCGSYTSGFTPAGATSIDSDGTCVSRGFPGMATLSAADVDLVSLANNGGPTMTRAIAPTSAAINAGTSLGCPPTDQRGVPRNDGFCDIGAYESGVAAPGRNYFVRTPAELEAAIFDARNSVGRDRIFLAPTVFPINSSTISTVNLFADDFGGPNDIKLIGAGAAATILEGGGLSDRNDVVQIGGSSLMTIEKMTIENGGANGIYNNGNLVLRDVVVRNHGGTGIQSVNIGLAISGSTISGNGAALNGGWGEAGIYVESTFSAVNTTIAGNHSAGVFLSSGGSGASLTNVTIDGNTGAGLAALAAISVTNTIVADNLGGDCDPAFPTGAVSGGHNLIGDSSCGFTAAGGDIGGAPLLGVLQDNGGPTPTMELLVGSPAIDAGGSGACPSVDQRGIARPQGAACDIGAFELELTPVNNAPTCVDYTGSTYAGGPPAGAVSCSDPDAGDTFAVSLVSDVSNGVLVLYDDGSFTYLPNSGFVGTDSFKFQATDSHSVVSNVATATITVTNQLPSCVDYTGSVTIGGSLNATVGCADPDGGDTFTVSLVSNVTHGTVVVSADGSFTYTPAIGYLGTDTFTYQATDSHNAVSAIRTATITVMSRPPVCQNFTGSVHAASLLQVPLFMDRVNGTFCSDPDGDAFSYQVVTSPAHGSVSLSVPGGGFDYRSIASYVGIDGFTFTATDSHGAVSIVYTATIQILNQAPACPDFTGSVLAGVTLSLGTVANVLCSDPDGDTFTYSVVTGPAHGTAWVSFMGSGFEYASNRTYIGSDSFTYKVTDSRSAVSSIATAVIQVVDTAPTCQNITGSVFRGGGLSLLQELGRSCSDPDPFDSLTYSVVTGPVHGTVDTVGTFSYITDSTSYVGPDSFTYQATDSRGVVSNVGTVTIQIINTGTGTNVGVWVPSPLSPTAWLTFNHVVTPGGTTAVSSTTGPPSPAGFQVPGGSLYWEISTTATYTGSINVCIVAPPGVSSPRLLHYQGGAWADVTNLVQQFGDFVCGSVTSLSPFVVAVKVPVQSVDVAAQLRQLEAMVKSFNLRKPVARRFIHRLNEVQEAWAETRHHKHHTKEFCNELEEFMRSVQKATGKTLTAAEAGQVLALARLIASEVPCGSEETHR